MNRILLAALVMCGIVQHSLALPVSDSASDLMDSEFDDDSDGSDNIFYFNGYPLRLMPENFYEPTQLEKVACTSIENLITNVEYILDLLNSVETIPDWIEQEDINKLSDSINSKPPEVHALFDDLVQAFNKYSISTDLAILNATDEIEYLIEQIHSDVTGKNFLVSNMTNLSDANKLNQICTLIDETEAFLLQFNLAIKNCFNKYREFVVPQLPTIAKQLKKLSSKHNNAILGAKDIEMAKTDIQNLITLIQSESKDIEQRASKAIGIFINCIQSQGNDCERHFNKMYKKFQTILN